MKLPIVLVIFVSCIHALPQDTTTTTPADIKKFLEAVDQASKELRAALDRKKKCKPTAEPESSLESEDEEHEEEERIVSREEQEHIQESSTETSTREASEVSAADSGNKKLEEEATNLSQEIELQRETEALEICLSSSEASQAPGSVNLEHVSSDIFEDAKPPAKRKKVSLAEKSNCQRMIVSASADWDDTKEPLLVELKVLAALLASKIGSPTIEAGASNSGTKKVELLETVTKLIQLMEAQREAYRRSASNISEQSGVSSESGSSLENHHDDVAALERERQHLLHELNRIEFSPAMQHGQCEGDSCGTQNQQVDDLSPSILRALYEPNSCYERIVVRMGDRATERHLPRMNFDQREDDPVLRVADQVMRRMDERNNQLSRESICHGRNNHESSI